jgi:hypothetical protein
MDGRRVATVWRFTAMCGSIADGLPHARRPAAPEGALPARLQYSATGRSDTI